jgi:hypothetical protein
MRTDPDISEGNVSRLLKSQMHATESLRRIRMIHDVYFINFIWLRSAEPIS